MSDFEERDALRADLRACAEALESVEKWLARPETEPSPGLRTIRAALARPGVSGALK